MRKIYLELFNKESKVIAYGPKDNIDTETQILSKNKINKLDYFLIVGRLIPDNNWDILVDGFNISKERPSPEKDIGGPTFFKLIENLICSWSPVTYLIPASIATPWALALAIDCETIFKFNPPLIDCENFFA